MRLLRHHVQHVVGRSRRARTRLCRCCGSRPHTPVPLWPDGRQKLPSAASDELTGAADRMTIAAKGEPVSSSRRASEAAACSGDLSCPRRA